MWMSSSEDSCVRQVESCSFFLRQVAPFFEASCSFF
jgi:hypothetical protein